MGHKLHLKLTSNSIQFEEAPYSIDHSFSHMTTVARCHVFQCRTKVQNLMDVPKKIIDEVKMLHTTLSYKKKHPKLIKIMREPP